MATAAGVRAGPAYVELGGNYNKLDRALKEASKKLDIFSKSAQEKLCAPS